MKATATEKQSLLAPINTENGVMMKTVTCDMLGLLDFLTGINPSLMTHLTILNQNLMPSATASRLKGNLLACFSYL